MNMIKGLLSLFRNKQDLAKSSIIIGIFIVCSRLFTICNYILIANKFGTSKELDTFLISQSIIDFIVALLTITLGVILIPIYIELKHKKLFYEIKKLIGIFTSYLIIISVLITIILLILANNITGILFSNTINSRLAINLIRISAFSLFPLIISGYITNILNANKKFIFPSLITLLFSLSPTICILLFSEILNIYSLAIATFIMSYGILISLLIYLKLCKYKIYFNLNFNNKYFIQINIISLPLMISASAVQINVLIDRIFASFLPTGSISALNYARNLREIPLYIVMSLTAIILPFFSEHANIRSNKTFVNFITKTIRIGLFLLIPSCTGLFLIKRQLIEILLFRGKFNFISMQMTEESLSIFLMSIIFYWLITIITRVFYAKRRFKIVIIMGILSILFNLVFDRILIMQFSYKGIALSTVFMEIIFCIIYFYLLSKINLALNIDNLLKSIIKFFIPTLIMSIAIVSNIKFVEIININKSILINLISIIYIIILSIIIYSVVSHKMKIEEYKHLMNKIQNKK